MPDPHRLAILLVADSMVRKGLELLLADMQIDVLSSGNLDELEKRLAARGARPDLVVLPRSLERVATPRQRDAVAWVRRLRARFAARIPAILLCPEPCAVDGRPAEADLELVPDEVGPAQMRAAVRRCLARRGAD